MKGLQLYLDEIGSQMSGRKVELIIEDDTSHAEVAASKLKKLIENDKVDITDGIVMSNIAYHVAPLADRLQIPMILAVPFADDLTKRKRCKYVVRASMAASQATQPFGEWVYKKLGYRRIVAVGDNFAYGWECVGGFQTSFENAGGKIIQKVWVPYFGQNFSQELKSIRQDADAVFFATASQSACIVAKQYAELGGKLPLIGVGSSFDETVLAYPGAQCVNAVSISFYGSSLDTPANKRFVQAYENKFGNEHPSFASESGYVSGLCIDKAVKSLKGDVSDHDKLLTALKAVRLDDIPRGRMKFDSLGNPIQNLYVFKVENVNGNQQNIVIDTLRDVSQFWKWNPEKYMSQPAYSMTYPPCKYCSDPAPSKP